MNPHAIEARSQAASEGLEPIGCVNDPENSHVFFFYFYNVTPSFAIP